MFKNLFRNIFYGPHEYNHQSHVGTLRDDETPDQGMDRALDSLSRHAAPGGHGTQVTEDGTNVPVTGLGDVTSTLDRQRRNVTNVTTQRHWLHPGVVVRTPVVRGRNIYINSHGTGSGLFPFLNNLFASPVWNTVDRQIAYDLTPGLRERDEQDTMEKASIS